MISLLDVFNEINKTIGIKGVCKLDEIAAAQVIISRLNAYLYQESGEYILHYHEY